MDKSEKQIKKLLPFIHIAKEWATIKICEGFLLDRPKLIEKFDEGWNIISIVNEKDEFQGFLSVDVFKTNFLKDQFPTTTDLFVEYMDDEIELKKRLAELLWEPCEELPVRKIVDAGGKIIAPRQEIPILKNNKIVGLGRFSEYFDSYGRWKAYQVFEYRWDWIDDGVAKEYFGNHRRILISSEHGELKGFKEAFSSWFDVEVYNDDILKDCIDGQWDVLIYASNVFDGLSIEKLEAHRVYVTLLAETLRRWLVQHGINFHYFSFQPEVVDVAKRVAPTKELVGGNLAYLREGVVNYFVIDENQYDRSLPAEKKKPNWYAGRRATLESNGRPKHAVHFFGPCTVAGYATYSFDKTIESNLQRLINKNGIPYYVTNNGMEGMPGRDCADLNTLFRIMDTKFSCGDIVIVFGNSFSYWDKTKKFFPSNMHYLNTPFISKPNDELKCFLTAAVAHMDVEGYRIMSEYIYQVISKEFIRRDFQTSFESFISSFAVRGGEKSRLNNYIQKFHPKDHVDDNRVIGSIVMRANPITKGHIYLIQEAMKQCDYLYVFLNDDDKPLLPIDDRKTFLEKKIKGNVIVMTCETSEREHMMFYGGLGPTICMYCPDKKTYNPVEDIYFFARYIAPKFNISKYFVGEECLDEIKRRYNNIKKEILMVEGIEYVEIPRLKTEDGREITTKQIRKTIEGMRLCKDFLPNELYGALKVM